MQCAREARSFDTPTPSVAPGSPQDLTQSTMFAKFLTLLPFVALASCASVSHELSRRAFDPSTHLGNLSPYFDAPVPAGMETELPADCTVDQVMLVRIR